MTTLKPKLLVVEDDISSQQYYTVILSDLYDLTMVSTVERAKQALSETKFRLAIVDISLPGDENGIDLIKFLTLEHGQTLPAIAISAHAFPQNRQDTFAAGAVEFYTKPILGGILIEIIKKYIQD
ncbi:MAG: response regulator [Candidatus Marinimicrobia bacterium]|nr:response regulator [FCB group bacterium]MBL7028252.1 response regulator [Candidatus Neomarinimicrobiota bacterium]